MHEIIEQSHPLLRQMTTQRFTKTLNIELKVVWETIKVVILVKTKSLSI